jgi:hypothetical protein
MYLHLQLNASRFFLLLLSASPTRRAGAFRSGINGDALSEQQVRRLLRLRKRYESRVCLCLTGGRQKGHRSRSPARCELVKTWMKPLHGFCCRRWFAV